MVSTNWNSKADLLAVSFATIRWATMNVAMLAVDIVEVTGHKIIDVIAMRDGRVAIMPDGDVAASRTVLVGRTCHGIPFATPLSFSPTAARLRI